MAYHSYIPKMFEFLASFENPKILEIGVDKGQTMYPLLHFFTLRRKPYSYYGIDVKIRQEIGIPLRFMNLLKGQAITLINDNSLSILPSFLGDYGKMDLILVDGDHNYFTVKQELLLLSKIAHDKTMIICDDFRGRWAKKDLYYSELPEYEDVKVATKRQITKKQGVAEAIGEFIIEFPEWKGRTVSVNAGGTYVPSDYVILQKDENIFK